MDMPNSLFSTICPEKGKKFVAFDKHSKYIVKILAPTDLSETLWDYAEYYYEAARKITELILYLDCPDIGKLDTYIFAISFLYRHCIELGLKAIGFQYIRDKDDQKRFINNTKHNLSDILTEIRQKATWLRPKEEIEWMQEYFDDLTLKDRESDSFRYPFHIAWIPDALGGNGKFEFKAIFDDETHVDLVKFANKFEAAFEIINKWYHKDAENAAEWKTVTPAFIETGGDYYAKAVVGYKFCAAKFYPYTKAYLEAANYLKRYMQKETEMGRSDCSKYLFLPMCYLYRNCLELVLKTIWFEDTGEDVQIKYKHMLNYKHSVAGMWRRIKPHIHQSVYRTSYAAYIDVIEEYCLQIHAFDSDANIFRYPMSNSMQVYFSHNKRFDFIETGNFFESVINILNEIDDQMDI